MLVAYNAFNGAFRTDPALNEICLLMRFSVVLQVFFIQEICVLQSFIKYYSENSALFVRIFVQWTKDVILLQWLLSAAVIKIECRVF